MAIRKEVTVKHGFSREEITEVVKATLALLWGYEETSPGIFESNIRAVCLDPVWLFTVDVSADGIINVASERKVPFTPFQSAEREHHRKIIKRFFDSLKHTCSTTGLAKSKPEAYGKLISAVGSDVNIVNASGAGCALNMIIIPAIMGVIVCALVIIAHIPRG